MPQHALHDLGIGNHTARHFPVQIVAKATYRDILERRAKENGIDFIEGLATAITPLAILGRRHDQGLQDPGRRRHGGRLPGRGRRRAQAARAATRNDAGVVEAAEIIARQNRIIAAMREAGARRYHDAIMARIDGKDLPPAPLDVEEEEDDDDDIHET